jgi:CIC family chloride channel protein
MRCILARTRGLVKRFRPTGARPVVLGDFTAGRETLVLAGLAVPIGVLGAVCALALVALIGAVTSAAYFGYFGTTIPALGGHHLGLWAIALPVLGGLAVGMMARFGSEQIRGHGIPEAIETILTRESRVSPRVALLKPVSSAVSIGTGGPFGAEGPIILTGGAIGSLVAQAVTLTAAERKVLLVCGAAAGMSGIFGTPVASILLAVELLLFEWKPRSLIPVAAASVTAMAVRTEFAHLGLMPGTPLFAVQGHGPLPPAGLACAAAVGVAGGLLAWIITAAVYGAEDLFRRLPIHWMWWPALAGLVVGVGGVVDRRALGVGYDTIDLELTGRLALSALVGLLVVKLAIWAIALGSGNSGGVVAPVLMMGAATGGILAPVMDGGSRGLWCLIGMTAAFSGVLRTPLTAVIFALELTAVANALVPLTVAAVVAYLVSVLVLKRSILTEKVARAGVHVVHEYAVDALAAVRVGDAMSPPPAALAADDPLPESDTDTGDGERSRPLVPVIDSDGHLVGVVVAADLACGPREPRGRVADRARPAIVAHPDETLRVADNRMTAHGVSELLVVDSRLPARLVGVIDRRAVLDVSCRHADHETVRTRTQWRRSRAPGAPLGDPAPLPPEPPRSAAGTAADPTEA